jgi:glycosyltransferase involved in cell wall biosynthesis
MRVLIASTLNSSQPFGGFGRTLNLGMYLAQQFEVFHLGLDCSAVDYAPSISVGQRSLKAYKQALQRCIDEFNPDVIYAQETLASIAVLTSPHVALSKIPLIFDFHTLSAFEYWTQLPSTSNKLWQLRHISKTYLAQGTLIFSGHPIIAAGQATLDLIPKIYPFSRPQLHFVGNGVAEDLLKLSSSSYPDPFSALRPNKIVAVIAPKASDYEFPSNDMSVELTLQIAQQLEGQQPIHFVIIGRDADPAAQSVPTNVTFTGFLPTRADFLAHLAHIDIGLLPFSKLAVAGGARTKALDYFACQKLVISTSEGLRGLETFQPHALVTRDSAQDLASTVVAACSDTERYRPLVSTAYKLVQRKYSWLAMADQVADVIKKQTQTSAQVKVPQNSRT